VPKQYYREHTAKIAKHPKPGVFIAIILFFSIFTTAFGQERNLELRKDGKHHKIMFDDVEISMCGVRHILKHLKGYYMVGTRFLVHVPDKPKALLEWGDADIVSLKRMRYMMGDLVYFQARNGQWVGMDNRDWKKWKPIGWCPIFIVGEYLGSYPLAVVPNSIDAYTLAYFITTHYGNRKRFPWFKPENWRQ